MQMNTIEMISVDSYLMCGGECVEKTDCSAFRVVEDEGRFRCEFLLKEGTGILMKDFFTLDY